MAKVGSVGGAGLRPASRAGRGAPGFAVNTAPGESAPADAATAARSVEGVSLAGLQEAPPPTPRERDAAAQRRASGLLHELAGLQRELLGQAADPLRADRLARLAEGEEGADPALRPIVQAIALRAAIERARRE